MVSRPSQPSKPAAGGSNGTQKELAQLKRRSIAQNDAFKGQLGNLFGGGGGGGGPVLKSTGGESVDELHQQRAEDLKVIGESSKGVLQLRNTLQALLLGQGRLNKMGTGLCFPRGEL